MLTSEQIGFFHAFPGFKAKHASDPSTEFVRLASMRNWEIGGETYIQYCQAFFKLDNKDSGPSSEDGGAVMTPSAFSGDSSHYDDHDRHDDAADQIEKAFQHLQLNTTIQEPVNKLKATTSITSCADGAGVKIRYFDTFQGFTHDKRAPIREEFARLAVQQKWTDRNGGMLKSEMYHRQMLRCYQEELFFHSRGYLPYLEVLQGLCRDLRSEETPVSITACKKVCTSPTLVAILAN